MLIYVPLGSTVHELPKATLLAKSLKEISQGANRLNLQGEKLMERGRRDPRVLTRLQLLDAELSTRDTKQIAIQGQATPKLDEGKQQVGGLRQPLQRGVLGLNVRSGNLLESERGRALSPEAASFKLLDQWPKKNLRNMFTLYRSRNLPHTYFPKRKKKQTID